MLKVLVNLELKLRYDTREEEVIRGFMSCGSAE
jgi:hypothetical protein